MSGFYGYARRSGAGRGPGEALAAMLAAVDAPRPTRDEGYADERVAVRCRQFVVGGGAAVDCTGQTGLVAAIDGYLLERVAVIARLRAQGVAAQDDWSDARLGGELWAQSGEGALACLEGDFNLCLIDPEAGHLRLASCRQGSRHLYYAADDGAVAFSTQVGALTAVRRRAPEIDRLALLELFNFGYIGGDRSLVEGVRLLPGGCVLEVRDGAPSLRRYGSPTFAGGGAAPRFDDLVDEAIHHLDAAVAACLDRFPRPAIPLSGGLDSRAILAFAAPRRAALSVYHCAWYGREAAIARQLARTCAARWHEYDPLTFDFARVLEAGGRISDGNVHCHQYWFQPVAADLAAAGQVDVVLDGYLMDVFFGDTFLVLPEREGQRYSPAARRAIVNRLWRRCHPAFVRRAFLPGFCADYEQANRDSIDGQMAAIDEDDISRFVHRFSFANRSNRYSVALPNVQRQYIEYAYPGLHASLVDLAGRIPPRYKVGAAFARAVLGRHAPAVAAVPWAKTGRPLARGKSLGDRLAEGLKLRQVGSLALLRASGGRWDVSHRADLNRHFRHHPAFRRAFLEIAQDERTLERGIIDRGGLARLVGMIDTGWPVFFLLQTLVTVELAHRRLVDGR